MSELQLLLFYRFWVLKGILNAFKHIFGFFYFLSYIFHNKRINNQKYQQVAFYW